MLIEALGVLIGFVGVMLMLSLIVTGLVQATQHFLNLRYRNLRFGVEAVLARAFQGVENFKPCEAAEAVLAPELPKSWFFKPYATWMTQEDFGRRLDRISKGKDADTPAKENLDDALQAFPAIESMLQARFGHILRLTSFAWALVVAVYFQVSAPELLHDLSIDPEKRARFIEAAEVAGGWDAPFTAETNSLELASERTLTELQRRHPDLQELEEASGMGRDRDELVEEIYAVLFEVPNRRSLVHEYESLLDLNRKNVALGDLEHAARSLARFDIEPWSQGLAFYFDGRTPRAGHWIGVLITAMLLSFGAPCYLRRHSGLLCVSSRQSGCGQAVATKPLGRIGAGA